jgi:hypothetical protein
MTVRSKNIDDYVDKTEARIREVDKREGDLLIRENQLADAMSQMIEEKKANQKILDDTMALKKDLTRQQNDLARQIEILDSSKIEMEEKSKALKEQVRLNELRIRQNQEKLDTLKQLRENKA